MYRMQEPKDHDITIHSDTESDEDGGSRIIITKVESNYLSGNEYLYSPVSSSKTMSSTSTTELAPTTSATTANASAPVIHGLGGFISDFQTLNMKIKRLRASEMTLKNMLESKQIELNKASEEWCTSQAQLAKNEMLLRMQTAEKMSLEHQAKNIEIQNTAWDCKLSLVSVALKSMFQTSKNLMEDKHIITSGESNYQTVNDNCKTLISAKKLRLRPQNIPLPLTQPQTQSCSSVVRVHIQNSEKGICLKKPANANIKLSVLRNAFSLRMRKRQDSLREIKDDLAIKNRQLYSITQLLNKPKLSTLTSHGNSMSILPTVKTLDPYNKVGKLIVNEKTAVPEFVTSSTVTGPMNHSRDYSVSNGSGFACICGKRFTGMGNLHRHLGSSDNAKKFSCDVCSMPFLFFNNLRRHMQVHHSRYCPPKTHGCRTCGAVFASKTEFMKGWKHRNGKCVQTMKEVSAETTKGFPVQSKTL